MGQPARSHATLARELREVMGGGFAFDRWVGRNDQFLDFTFSQPRGQFVESQFPWPDAIQRAQPALQHEVQAAIAGRLLDREAIGR